MNSMKISYGKIIIVIFSILFSFLLATFVFILTVFNSERGSRWFLNQVSIYSHHIFSYQQVSGALWHQFAIQKVTVELPNLSLRIQNLSVTWNVLPLLKLQWQVPSIRLHEVNVQSSHPATLKDIELSLHGPLLHPNWQLEISGMEISHWQPIPTLFLGGEVSPHTITIQQIHSVWWPSSLHFVGRYDWHLAHHLDAHIFGELDPYFWTKSIAHLPSQLSVDVLFQLNGPDEGNLFLKKIAGRMDGHEVEGSGKLHWSKDLVDWQNWFIHVDKAQLNISGQLSKNSHLNWLIHIPDLAYWLPTGHGEIFSQGLLKGDWQNPYIEAFAHIMHLHWLTYEVDSLQATIKNQDIKNFKLAVVGKNISWQDNIIQQLSINGKGNWAQNHLQAVINWPIFAFRSPQWHLAQAKAQLSTDLIFDAKGRPQGTLTFQLWPLVLSYQANDYTQIPIEITQGDCAVTFHDNTGTLQANVKSNWGNGMANIMLPMLGDSLNVQWLKQPVQGSVDWHFDQLNYLQNLLPALQNIEGEINLHTQISGMLNQPHFHVKAELLRGSASWLTYNLTLKPVALAIEGDLQHSLLINGIIGSGAGRLQLTGRIENIFGGLKIALKIAGKNFLATNLFFYKIWASPELLFECQATQMRLTGNIFIPKARLNFTDYTDKVISPSSDIQFVSEQNTVLNFLSDLNLILGDDISLTYGGLSGKVEGKVNLMQTAGASVLANGQLRLVNGSYKAYGQSLTIQKGTATYVHRAASDPILDFQAVKTFHNISSLALAGGFINGAPMANPDGTLVVGVKIAGPLSSYKMQLFSMPSGLTQSDILSYLILGVPAAQAGSGGGQLLLSAASALGGNSTSNTVTNLQNEVKQSLGIDVNVGTVSQYNPNSQQVTQSTALILSKALSPRLYLSYSAAVGEGASIFNVKYQISRSWMAQTESSTFGNGADIYYTIDR